MSGGSPRLRALLPAVAFAAAGCSTFPATGYPAYREESVEVRYRFADGDERTISLPYSTPDLTILELSVEPGGRETFAGSDRLLRLPAGTTTATVRCRYRSFGDHAPEALFPGAASITRLAEPRIRP